MKKIFESLKHMDPYKRIRWGWIAWFVIMPFPFPLGSAFEVGLLPFGNALLCLLQIAEGYSIVAGYFPNSSPVLGPYAAPWSLSVGCSIAGAVLLHFIIKKHQSDRRKEKTCLPIIIGGVTATWTLASAGLTCAFIATGGG